MSKIEIIKYKCDICNKEFENEKSIKSESVPCYGGEEGAYRTNACMDLCEECSTKIRRVIFDNFAEIIDYYGLSVKKKF